MDNRGTIELTGDWGTEVPANGFELVAGYQAITPELKIPDTFLVARPGGERRVPIPNDAYATAANLKLDNESLLTFANSHGWLRLDRQHFHATDTGCALTGEPLRELTFQLKRFQMAVDVWYKCNTDLPAIKSLLNALKKPGASWLLQPPIGKDWDKTPIGFARAMVMDTINIQLGGVVSPETLCGVRSCRIKSQGGASQTRAYLRSDPPRLCVVSTDLLKTLWLQFAEHVCGQRKLARCEGCNDVFDVTEFKRPGAKRMHDHCEERIRKQKYRARKRQRTK